MFHAGRHWKAEARESLEQAGKGEAELRSQPAFPLLPLESVVVAAVSWGCLPVTLAGKGGKVGQ